MGILTRKPKTGHWREEQERARSAPSPATASPPSVATAAAVTAPPAVSHPHRERHRVAAPTGSAKEATTAWSEPALSSFSQRDFLVIVGAWLGIGVLWVLGRLPLLLAVPVMLAASWAFFWWVDKPPVKSVLSGFVVAVAAWLAVFGTAYLLLSLRN